MSQDVKKMGRPPVPIDWKQVEALCRIHCTKDEIAEIIQCSPASLYRHVKEEFGITFDVYYQQHTASGKMSLRRAMWDKAIKKEYFPAQKFLAENHLGMAEKVETVQTPTVTIERSNGDKLIMGVRGGDDKDSES